MKEYYDRRAPEYDDWYLGTGMYAGAERPGFDEELEALTAVLASLRPARTLDVACGTGFLSRHLPGEVTCVDQSGRMLAIASRQAPHARLVQADVPPLPFDDDDFERVVTGHFYGHLEESERARVLAEMRRVAPELVVVDASRAHADVDAEWQSRLVGDGSCWPVYKRYFRPEDLLHELAGGPGDVLHAGRWFVAVRSPR